MPIFIINTQSKNEFQLIRSIIIDEVKKISNLELHKCVYTPIKEDSLLKFINDLQTHSFSNNILGQVWDISFDFNQREYNFIKPIIKDNICTLTINSYSQSLIIVLNQQYLMLDDLFWNSIII